MKDKIEVKAKIKLNSGGSGARSRHILKLNRTNNLGAVNSNRDLVNINSSTENKLNNNKISASLVLKEKLFTKETKIIVLSKANLEKVFNLGGDMQAETYNYKKILSVLKRKYPACFTKSPTPLAIGINLQLKKDSSLTISNSKLKRFLGQYTRKPKYRIKLVLGTNRVNLDGTVNSQVTEEQLPENFSKAKES